MDKLFTTSKWKPLVVKHVKSAIKFWCVLSLILSFNISLWLLDQNSFTFVLQNGWFSNVKSIHWEFLHYWWYWGFFCNLLQQKQFEKKFFTKLLPLTIQNLSLISAKVCSRSLRHGCSWKYWTISMVSAWFSCNIIWCFDSNGKVPLLMHHYKFICNSWLKK